jgi:hypothetical protein
VYRPRSRLIPRRPGMQRLQELLRAGGCGNCSFHHNVLCSFLLSAEAPANASKEKTRNAPDLLYMFIHTPLGNRRRATPEIAVVDLLPRSAGWGRSRGGMNSAGSTVSKSFPRPSTVTIDSSLRPDQPLRSADPEEVNKRKILEVCATNFHRECYCTMSDKERLFVRIRHKTGEGPAVIH